MSRTDAFLTFNERDVLTSAGRVSATDAETQVTQVYTEFDIRRREREAQESLEQEERDLAELLEIERGPRPDEDRR